MNENRRTIEINGCKFDVDMSTARKIDEFKVGDNVKVLKKGYDDYMVIPGVIVEFADFKSLPTVVIATFTDSYSGSQLDFIHFNEKTKEIEFTACAEHELKLEKSRVLDKMNAEIEKKKNEIGDLEARRDYFLKYFGKYFE